jgi:hypothetical protein
MGRNFLSHIRQESKARNTIIYARTARAERRKALRAFYAFDPRRTAILLIGDDKTGDDRFYKRMIPIADRLYDEHVAEIRKEGLIK